MKPKVFKDETWPIGMFMVLLFTGGSIAIFGLVGVLIKEMISAPSSSVEPIQSIVGILAFIAAGIGIAVCANGHLFYDPAFRRLYVYEKKVVLRGFLRKTITLTLEDCKYVGIEDYSLLNRGMPILRGDEISYIYLSEEPYPQKYHGKITALKSKKGFIKFRYSDAVAEALLEILPDDKDYLIRGFYGKMKANDRLARAKKRGKKKK